MTSGGSELTPSTRWRCGYGTSRLRSCRTRWCCWGTRSTPTSPRTTPWTSSARGATRAALRARMSRTSRSTPGSTGTRGETRRYGGSSRPCPLPWSSTTTRSRTTGTSPRPGSRRRVSTRGGTTRSPARTPPTGSTSTSATSPKELAANELFEKVRTADDAWPLLREFASHAHRTSEGTRWSSCRDFGNVRLIVMDSRGGRVLEEGRRSMVDAREWAWIEDKANGSFDHLLLATSLPVLLGPGMHHLQAWNEAVCAGAWGERSKALGGACPALPGPGPLGLVPELLRRADRPDTARRLRGEGRPPILHNDPLRRRPPRLPRRSLPRRRRREEPDLPGRLLPLCATLSLARSPASRTSPGRSRSRSHIPPLPPRRRQTPRPELAPDPREPLVREPRRDPATRRQERPHHLRRGRNRRLQRARPPEVIRSPPRLTPSATEPS